LDADLLNLAKVALFKSTVYIYGGVQKEFFIHYRGLNSLSAF